ncbi:MAG: Dph6-related ATP pyrophosphatase [Acidimicrobiia bacterium]
MTTPTAWMSWSSGKDSTYALHVARAQGVDVRGLLVCLNGDADRVAMHAVRRRLVEAQAEQLELPLHVVEIPSPCPNDLYESRMAAAMAAARTEGVEQIVFGDLFLEDVRAYRERNLAGTGLTAVFPLWGRPTDALAREMLAAGVRAVLTCVDPTVLPADLTGRAFDEQLLAELPAGVDPCGERGEFHTFVWDGPGFRAPIPVEVGETVARDGFVFRDVVAAAG